MGYYDEPQIPRVCFDIETAPLADAADYIEPAEAPGNYKDAAKIAAFIAEKNAENLDRCGLDADLCRIVAIGIQVEGKTAYAINGDDEAGMLNAFWKVYGDRHLIGFNCVSFDLPVMLRRSQYLGVQAPAIQLDKYRHPTVTDLAMVLSFNGLIRMRSLSFYAKRFGVTISTPDTLTGADIAKAVAEGRWAEIDAHVTGDVEKTAAIAARLGYFRPAVAAVV